MKTMKNLFLDCSSGLSGDMFLAGLVDLGFDLKDLEAALQSAGVSVSLVCHDTTRQGLAGKHLVVTEQSCPPLRRLVDIQAVVSALPVSENVRGKSQMAFERLAQVEARVHGMDVQDVHFHEVGAADTIVDVVGAFLGLEALGIREVRSSALPWFKGSVTCAHGRLPLPAPAVVELLRDKPVYPTAHECELITPTGALLLDQLVACFDHGPCGMLLGCGMGMGRMDLASQPNVVRCFLTDAGERPFELNENLTSETIVVLETNIDHLTGEELGACFEALLGEGALDVLFLPGVMKKSRPGGLMQVLCRHQDKDTIMQAVFRQTMTLGVRRQTVQRIILDRETIPRQTPLGTVNMKEICLDEQHYSRPEYEALQTLAKRTGRSVAQLRYLLQSHSQSDRNG